MPETTHAEEFLEALTAVKEKLKQENRKKEKKEKTKQEKEKEEIKKPAEISIEKEAPFVESVKHVKPLSSEFTPPIYKRSLPRLLQAPKYTEEEWPLRPPRPPARPPEEEAAAPPIASIQMPARALKMPAKLLDLGKLNYVIANPVITTIQCDGANIPIKIIRAGKIQETTTVLSEEEIKSIIKAFSDSSKQAITEPVFKASVSGWTISATVSAFAGCKFVITRG